MKSAVFKVVPLPAEKKIKSMVNTKATYNNWRIHMVVGIPRNIVQLYNFFV
jgi:hypothetical protein